MPNLKGWVFTLALMALASLVSHWPTGQAARGGVLRLSWKTTGEKVRVAIEEDPNLPVHMRVPGGAYETRILPYRLQVQVNASTRLDQRVSAPGVHHDRPLCVLEELTLPAGPAQVHITFTPEGTAAPAESPRYDLQTQIEVKPGRVVLVTLDPATRQLLLKF